MENVTVELIIYYIILLAIGLIFLITLITIINYVLYSVYSINAIRREYTYNNSPFFKLDQIYNYMLINYVYLLDKKRHIRFNKTNYYYSDPNDTSTRVNEDVALEKGEDANNDFKDVVYYYDYSYIEKQIEDAIANNKPDNYIYIKSPIKDNVYCKYEKINDDLGFFDNIFKFLWELRYSYVLHDANAADLYVHLNNRFYEMVLFVLFIILLIFVIKIIYTLTGNLLSTIKDDEISEIDTTNIFRYVYNKKFSTIIIIIVILLYCMLHSILYKKLFIDNVYDRIHGMYKEITKIDLQMQGDVNMLIDNLLINKEIVKKLYVARKELDDAKAEASAATGDDTKAKALQLAEATVVAAEAAMPGSGNYNKTIGNLLKLSHIGNLEKRDTIIDFADPVNDSKAQLELFTKKMLVVNKKFNISNYDKLFNLKEYINTCLNTHRSTITCDSKDIVYGAEASFEDPGKNYEDNILASQLFIIIIYIYFVSNNKDDPYILIKLNKLILGQIVKVGDKDIDKDIEYTITLRSLLYEKLDHEQTRNQLNNINSIINNYIFKNCKDGSGKEINKYKHVKALIDDKIKLFTENIENANNNLNFFTPVYFFNLYLALEMGLNFVVILIILFSMLTYDENTPELKAKIEETVEWIKVAKDEIITAIYGVI